METEKKTKCGRVIKNKGDLLDVIPYIPETVILEEIQRIDENIDYDAFETRIQGIIRWFVRSTYDGNRNVNLFRVAMLCLDLNIEVEDVLYRSNSLLTEPVRESEILSIINSAKKRHNAK